MRSVQMIPASVVFYLQQALTIAVGFLVITFPCALLLWLKSNCS